MLVPYLLKRSVDAVSAGRSLGEVGTYASLIIAVALVQGVVRTLSRVLVFNAGRDVEFDLRNDLFAHLLKLPQAYYLEQRTGDLMSRLVNDVNAVRMLLGVGFLNLLNTPIYYVYAVSIMLSLDVRLTVVALLPYPFLLWVVKRYSRQLMEGTVRVQAGLADLSSRVQENLSGITAIKAYVRQEHEGQKFAAANDAFVEESMRLAEVRARMMPVMKLAASLGTLAVLWYGGMHVIDGKLSLGDLVAFIGYLNLLAWPTMAMGWMISIVQRGRAAMMRLEHIFGAEVTIADPLHDGQAGRVAGAAVEAGHAREEALEPSGGDLELRNVTFAYPVRDNGHPVLRDVSLRLGDGKKLAVVGRTGSGKSTLLSLLPRLFDVTDGSVRIGGRDVRDVGLQALRRRLGVVPQDPFLFSTTIRENIAFAVDGASEERIRAAAEAAGVADDIESFPAGYDTLVGERGITLSGGQRQRLSLARALLTDPALLLLDDALSSVDTRTERRILASLRELRAARTTVMVAHRMSAIQDADLIVVLDDGRIVEAGDHAELLGRDGLYAELFQRQRLEEEIDEL